jgi:uridine kinase
MLTRAAPPPEVDDYGKLLAEVRPAIAKRVPKIVGVEGFMASGKTHLSKRLAGDLGCAHIETDDSSIALLNPEHDTRLDKNKHYVDRLGLSHLRKKIDAALAAQPWVIVDGICLRDTLSRISLTLDLTIYVKTLPAPFFRWDDGLHIEDFEEGERVRGLNHDVLEYHSRVRPHERADIIYAHREGI